MPFPDRLGMPSAHDGAFGAAERLIADVQGADGAIMSVTGSSGSNQAVVLMLSRLSRDARVLVARNAHHSTIHALIAFGVSFEFLPSGYHEEFEALLPPTPHEVAQAIERSPATVAVLLTTPTYEGLAANVESIAQVVHGDRTDRLLIVDEAWGSHLAFHPSLPTPALHLGADLVVQSTHKQGGSLQQTGVILWHTDRVDKDLIREAHGQWTTTSPSFSLLASIEGAHRELAVNGEELLARSIERTDKLNTLVGELRPELRRFATPERLAELGDRVVGHDATKTTFALTEYGISGHDVAQRLIGPPHEITLEKAGLNTVTFLTPFQLPEGAEQRAARALAQELGTAPSATTPRLPPDPFATLATAPDVDPTRTSRAAWKNWNEVPAAEAVGHICAETVEAFPPGIPVLLPGFTVTQPAIDYLVAVRECNGTIHAANPDVSTFRILPPDRI